MPREKKAKKEIKDNNEKGEKDELQLGKGDAQPVSNPNLVLLEHVSAMREKVLQHPMFNDLEYASPLSIGDGGRQEPWDFTACQTSLTENGVYVCGGNLFWNRFTSLGMPHVHTNLQSISNVKNQFMREAGQCDLREVVLQVVDPEKDPRIAGEDSFVKMRLLSCEEFVIAFLEKVCEDMDQLSGKEADEALKKHKKTILTTTMEFRFFQKGPAGRDFFCINYREKLVGHGDTAARTPLQRSEEISKKRHDILKLQDSKRKVGAQVVFDAISKEYAGIQWAPSSDKINFNAVDVLLTLHDRMFSDTVCRDIVVRGEEYFAMKGEIKKSPFHSYSKLEALVKKAKDIKSIKWSLNQMLFVIQEKYLDAGEVTHNNLLGKHKPGNVGLVETWLFKRSIAVYCQEHLKSLGADCSEVLASQMDKLLDGHSEYKDWSEKKDIIMLPCAGQQAMKFLEDVAYKQVYDGNSIREALKARLGPKDTLGKDTSMASAWTAVLNAIEEEQKGMPGEVARDQEAGNSSDGDCEPDASAFFTKQMREKEGSDDGEIDEKQKEMLRFMVNIRIPEDVVDKNQDLLHWAKYVVRMCTDTCSIVVDKDNSIDDLSKLIQGTPAGRMKGGVKLRGVVTYVGIWTQHTNGFEANSRAWDRPAPYTQCQDIIKRRIAAVCASRPGSTGETMEEGDIFFHSDGFKSGLKDAIAKLFTPSRPKCKGLIHLNFTSECLSERKKRIAGAFGSRKSVQYVHIFSKLKLKQESKDRIHFSGKSLDDCLGPVHLPSYDSAETFKVKHKEKSSLYGECRVRCGGRVEESESSGAEEAAHKAPSPSDMVPMTYAGMSWKVFDELVHDCNLVAWLETTMVDTTLAEVCVHRKMPYTGVVPTQQLADQLMVRLVERVWEASVDESHREHKFALVKLLKDLRPKVSAGTSRTQGSSKTTSIPKTEEVAVKAEGESAVVTEPEGKGSKRKEEAAVGGTEPKRTKGAGAGKKDEVTASLLAKLQAFEQDG